MAITPVIVADAIADELPKIFDDAIENERAGQPNYIKSGTPTSTVGRIAQAVSRAACRNYGAQSSEVQAAAAERYERACRPYLDDIGTPGDGIGLAPPFQGGQCDCNTYEVNYVVEGTSDQFGGPFTRSNCFRVRGPLGAPFKTNNNSQFSFTAKSGRVSCSNIPGTCGEVRQVQIDFWGFPSKDAKLTQFTVANIAQPGVECGNPAPVVTEPDPIPDPQPPPFRFNPIPDIDIPITVDIGPDGDIIFDIGGGPITVDPFPDGGGGGGGGSNPPTPGDPGDPVDTGPGGDGGTGGESEGDAPPGKVLTGVRIDVLAAPSSRARYTEAVDRGVAYVYMGTPSEGVGLEPTGSLVKSGQFFFAQKDYLTRWEVRAKFGYNLRTTPYYKDAPV